MIIVYEILQDVELPLLRLITPSFPEVLPFDGSPKGGRYPDSFIVKCPTSNAPDPLQFLALAPGLLVFSESAYKIVGDDFYYCISMGSELISIMDSCDLSYRAINTLVTLAAGNLPHAPCLVDKFYAPIFRINGLDPTRLFCAEGVGVSGDEFKYNYCRFGFKGLRFNEIWRNGLSVSDGVI